jgi:hypothetical protein
MVLWNGITSIAQKVEPLEASKQTYPKTDGEIEEADGTGDGVM